jgi:hypothetical protein
MTSEAPLDLITKKRRRCYHPATWHCVPVKVTCLDAEGIEHTVQVTAQTLSEAVAQALRAFREHDWCAKALHGAAVSVLVKITPPEVEHWVRIRDFESWLESAGKSPAEMILKNRLRQIVSG